MTFGEKIKALRLQRGMTLEQVGERVGVGKSTVRKWESGQIANMRRDKIALLAKALGVEPSYLMGWDDEPVKAQADDDAKWTLLEHERSDPDRKALFMLSKYGSAKDIRQVNAIFDALKATNPDAYDGDDPA